MTTTATAARGASAPVSWDRRLRIAGIVVSCIGLGIAVYLTIVHYSGGNVACTNSGCHTVQTSIYAKLGGIPVPVLGLVGYITILASFVLLRGDLARMAGFGLVLIGFLFSGYLTYRELFTIKAICEWCVGSAVCMTVLMIITAIRAIRGEPVGARA
jgi:uncharacterized membrane protein